VVPREEAMMRDLKPALLDLGLGPFTSATEGGESFVLSGGSVLMSCSLPQEAEVVAECLTAIIDNGDPAYAEDLVRDAGKEREDAEEEADYLKDRLLTAESEIEGLENRNTRLSEENEELRGELEEAQRELDKQRKLELDG